MTIKRLILFFLCFLMLFLSSCVESLQTASSEDTELSFLREHTVFKTSVVVTFDSNEDADLLTKRLNILGAEVVEIMPQGENVTYTILSHFPVSEDTVEALIMESGAKILKEDGTVVLNSEEVLSVECDIVSLALYVPHSFSREDILGKLVLAINDKEYIRWASTKTNGAQCYLDCSLDEVNVATLHTFAISMYPEDFLGNVSIKISKASERVADKMQN